MPGPAESPVLDVRVLGVTEVSVAGVPIRLDRPLERALAARLALARGAGVADDTLARDLWGDTEQARPAQRLRVLASRLRQSLNEHAGAVLRTPAGYALRAAPVDLDAVDAAIRRAKSAHRGGDVSTAREATAAALETWRGSALADLRGYPFARVEGERLDALRLDLQVEWLEAELDRDPDTARSEAERLAAEHPLHERLVCLAALSLYRTGRQAEALARLARLRTALVDELGVDPAPATAELELLMLRQDPALEPATAGPPAAALPVLSLSPSGSAFVGRDGELGLLVRQLADPGVVSLTGGPGIGKTRLAREVAASLQATGRPIAWLDLTPVRTPAAVAGALATAVGVEPGPTDPVRRIAEQLSGALLVVDNAEHLIDAVADLINSLRLTAAALSVLVTSQRPLRISGEELHQVRPLPPQAAAQLFCLNSGSPPDDQIDEICAAVDRLPLAIELAAGLTRTLTVPQLAGRIDDRLRLLVGGSRDAGRRHTSLRAALDWSHDLLDRPARTVVRRLAVFVGGCTLEAAEQVVAGDSIEAADLPALLGELADRSLVTVRPVDGVPRFGLLETVHEYALDRLRSSGEETAVRRRHAVWCADLAGRTEMYGGADHAELDRLLLDEQANLTAALEWSLNGGEPARVLEIVTPTWWFWWSRGRMAEARGWLRRSLATTEPAPTVERAAALRAAASLTRNAGDFAEARELGEQALTICRSIGDDVETNRAMLGLCITALALQDFDAALRLGEEARDRAGRLQNQRVYCSALNMIGLTLRCLGRHAEAEAVFVETYERWQEQNDRRGLASTETNLGIVARQSGDSDGARRWFLAALRRYREISLVEGELDCLDGIACLEVAEGDASTALQLLTVADRHRDRLGAPLFVADEIADRAAALAAAREILGADAERSETAARELRLEVLVDSLLAGAD